MSRKLTSTLVMLQPVKRDEAAALGALGPAIEELDRAAQDAGFRLRLIVMHDKPPDTASTDAD